MPSWCNRGPQNLKTERLMTARKLLYWSSIIVFFLISLAASEGPVNSFTPGQAIRDTDGNPIKAFAGGISYFKGIYYWYGEFKNGTFPTAEIPCYTSTDLLNWKYQGDIGSRVASGKAGPLLYCRAPTCHLQRQDKEIRDVDASREQGHITWGSLVSSSPPHPLARFPSAASFTIVVRMAAAPTTTTTATNPSSKTTMERPTTSFLPTKTMVW